MSKKIIDYKIYDAAGDLKKNWFVHYNDGKKRVRVYALKDAEISINTHPTAKERLKACQQIISVLRGEKILSLDMDKLLEDMAEAIELRLVEKKTKQDYTAKLNAFSLYVRQKGIGGMSEFEPDYFLAWLHNERELEYTTINGYVSALRTIFRSLIKRGKYAGKNPFQEVEKIKAEHTPAKYFTKSDLARLKPYLAKSPQLEMYVKFIYYCFIRPKELRGLKVSDINIEERKICVPASVSKNKQTQYVAIPDAFFADVAKWVNNRVNRDFLFPSRIKGKGLSINTMYNKFRKILKDANFDDSVYCLYSMKHTGAVHAIQNGVDIKSLQVQLRHSSLDMTDRYLRQIGVQDLAELRANMPAF